MSWDEKIMGSGSTGRAGEGVRQTSVCRIFGSERTTKAHHKLKFVEHISRLSHYIIALVHRWTKNDRRKNASVNAGEATIRILRTSSPPTVAVAGQVTVDSSPRLRSVLQQLIREGIGPVLVIDLSEVSYSDTSGIATLIEASKTAREYSAQLRLVGMSGQPRVLAEVTELEQIFRASGSEVVCS
jgi:anti-sigma B factor antagonist